MTATIGKHEKIYSFSDKTTAAEALKIDLEI